jgi:hypothetical protein
MFRDRLTFRDENKDWNRLEDKVVSWWKTSFFIVVTMWVVSGLVGIAFLGFICWVVYAILKHNGIV